MLQESWGLPACGCILSLDTQVGGSCCGPRAGGNTFNVRLHATLRTAPCTVNQDFLHRPETAAYKLNHTCRLQNHVNHVHPKHTHVTNCWMSFSHAACVLLESCDGRKEGYSHLCLPHMGHIKPQAQMVQLHVVVTGNDKHEGPYMQIVFPSPLA